MKKSSWGLLDNHDHNVYDLVDRYSCIHDITKKTPGIAYGNGRSYGDICLNPDGFLWDTKGLNKYISFDKDLGILVCEAGLLLQDVNSLSIPSGWMLPVTPGTQLGTIGGAIANDIHGKNHHRFGSFGNHIINLTILKTNGELIECSPNNNSNLFYATIGGIGLTGIILSVSIKLRKIKSSSIESENITYSNLNEFFAISKESEEDWEHTVSWLDCTAGGIGKGIFTRSNFLDDNNYDLSNGMEVKFPFKPPFSLINKPTLKIFNEIYYQLGKNKRKRFSSNYAQCLYPLDRILNWNRMYGKKGFYQYQSVIPKKNSYDATKEMLNIIKKSNQGSFLAVLKTFGSIESLGMLSFPMEGVTLALDFPNKGKSTLKLFSKLDKVVEETGGRIYMAKDSCMSRTLFETGYPKFKEFIQYRDSGISSSMSRRLFGD